jgi:exosortase
MEFLRTKHARLWVIPLACCAAFFIVLAGLIPYSSSLGEIKRPLAGLILDLTQFGPTGSHNATVDFSYCLFVPVVFAVMVFLRRREIAATRIRGSNLALVWILLGMAVYWFGLRAENQYFGYAALQILLAGTILWFWGTEVFWILLFPWVFFFFAWPVPFLDPIVSFPLRMDMSTMAGHFLPALGVPTVQSGTALLSAPDAARGLRLGDRFEIDIADPCSGIRSLFALLMFSALYGYLGLPRLWQQWVVFLSAFPLAIVGNLVRVLLLVFGSIWLGTAFAVGTSDNPSWFHEACGMAVYVVALGAEFFLGWCLTRNWKGAPDQPADGHPAS